MELHEQFERHGYTVVKSLLDAKTASSLDRFAQSHAASGSARSDDMVPGTPAVYADPLMEKVLRNLVPVIEKASRRKLFPTYSYFRVYRHGDSLARHKDRPSCEISVSVCLGYRAPEPWPLFVQGPSGVFAAMLEPGDGLLYKGVECAHWRYSFAGESATQVFFHYVDQNGPHAEWRFDKRLEPGPAVFPLAAEEPTAASNNIAVRSRTKRPLSGPLSQPA